MSGFDKDWLALREPVDGSARDQQLVSALAGYFTTSASGQGVIDIGCGTGSTYRALAPALSKGLAGRPSWTLLDYDPLLLAEAARRIGEDKGVVYRQHDLNDLVSLDLAGVAVVTASALFDLCSRDFCAQFCAHLSDTGTAFYAALNYDGKISWSLPHPLDAEAVSNFNAHQRTEKGFGPALGPDATDTLADLFKAKGYKAILGDSPWHMSPDHVALQQEFLHGFREPLLDIGRMSERHIDEWLAFRLSAIVEPNSLCEVGHSDILALPV